MYQGAGGESQYHRQQEDKFARANLQPGGGMILDDCHNNRVKREPAVRKIFG